MAYKDKSLKHLSIRISDDCNEKLTRLWVDLRYSSKQRFAKEIFERAIDGIFTQVYKDEVADDATETKDK